MPALVLSAESCLPPLARAWLRASARHWDRMQKAPPGSLLRSAMAGDLTLAHSLPRTKVHRTWSGAWLRTLGWLASGGDAASQAVGPSLSAIRAAAQAGTSALQTLRCPLTHLPLAAWDGAVKQRMESARANALAAYRDSFALGPKELPCERGFPPQMPLYFRHTSAFRHHDHVRALMRVRCCSTPFAACPTLHTGAPTVCRHCPAAAESAAHVLLDCPAYAALRASAPFSSLFPTAPSAPAPAPARLHALVRVPDQYTLGAFVHACFEQRARLLSDLESA